MDLVGSLFCQVCNVPIPHESVRESHNQGKKHQLALHMDNMEKHYQVASVYIAGFPNKIEKEKIVNFMAQFGEVQSYYLAPSHSFMITTYKKPEVAQELIKKQKVNFFGKNLTVEARRNVEKPIQPPEPIPIQIFAPILRIISNQKSFADEVFALCNMIQPDLTVEIQRYLHLCKDLEIGLQSCFPRAIVHPFGSTTTGLAFRDSDVDAYIQVPKPGKTKGNKSFSVTAVHKSRDCLLRNPNFANLVSIPRAKTPIVKCVHRPTGIKCDFNFKNMLGVYNSFFIRHVVHLDPKIKCCLLVLKFWGKIRLLSLGNWTFSNYAMTIMFIYYLQQEPIQLPSIRSFQENPAVHNFQDGWNCGFDPNYPVNMLKIRETPMIEYLYGFFKFCAEFDYTNNVMSPYLGKTLPKTCFVNIDGVPLEFEQYRKSYNDEHLNVSSPICLQDPFQHNRNITGSINIKVFEEYMEEIKRAFLLFEKQDPHMLYNLLNNENEEVTHHEIRIKMCKQKELQFLGIKLNGQQDQVRNLRLAWFDLIVKFTIDVLRDVFKFVLDIKKDDSPDNAKKMKSTNDVMESHYDTLHATGRCFYNVWDARNVISNDITFSESCNNNSLQRQVEITEYIQKFLLQSVMPRDPIVNISFSIQQFLIDTHVNITLEMIKDKEECSSFYSSFALFFTKSFPTWFAIYVKERNKAYKELLEKNNSSIDTNNKEEPRIESKTVDAQSKIVDEQSKIIDEQSKTVDDSKESVEND